jgi:hypothetical protein
MTSVATLVAQLAKISLLPVLLVTFRTLGESVIRPAT